MIKLNSLLFWTLRAALLIGLLPVTALAVPQASSISVSPTSVSLGGSVNISVTISKSSGDVWLGGVAYIYATPPGAGEQTVGAIDSSAYSSSNTASFSFTPSSSGTWSFRSNIVGSYQNGPVFGGVNSAMTSPKTVSIAGSPPPPPPPPPQNQAPSVSALSASSASPYEGSSVTLSATASDPDGTIKNVKFYRDNALVLTDTTSTYSYSDTMSSPGSRGYYAIATDNNDATSAASATKTITWVNKAPVVQTPTVSSSSIQQGQSVTVYVTGSDPGGLKYVRFYRNNALAYTITNPSDTQTSFSWTYSNASSGTHAFKVQVEDDEGSTATSSSVNVTTQAPTAGLSFDPLISPGPVFYNGQEIAINAATNAAGVSRVQFYHNGGWVFTDLSAPYTYHMLPAYSGNHTVEAYYLNSSGAQVLQSSISFSVSTESAPYKKDRWVDINNDGIYDYVEDVVTPNKNPNAYNSYIRYGAPNTGSRGLLMFHVPDFTSYCTTGWLGIASSTSFTLISDRINGFFGGNWGWNYSISSNVWVHDHNCDFTIHSIGNRMDYSPAYPDALYQIQTSSKLDNTGWTDQGLETSSGPYGNFQVVFGEYEGIRYEPNVARVVRLGADPTMPGYQLKSPVSVLDVNGDGRPDWEQELVPTVRDIIPQGLQKIFDIEIPTGVIVDPTGSTGGKLIQVKMRTIGDVVFEKTVEYIVNGEISPALDLSIAGFGDSMIDLRVYYLGSPDQVCDPDTWVEEDVNGDGVMEKVWKSLMEPARDEESAEPTGYQSKALISITPCQAVQVQYRLTGNDPWKSTGNLFLNKSNLCQSLKIDVPEGVNHSNEHDVQFRVVRYTAQIDLDSLNVIGIGETKTLTVSYLPSPIQEDPYRLDLFLELRLTDGAKFVSTGNQVQYIEGIGDLSFDVEMTGEQLVTLSARLATRDVENQLSILSANGICTEADVVPVEVISDLNNNGMIDGEDRTTKYNGAKSGATDEEMEKATEYMFVNDSLSNGLWDKDDPDPGKPQNMTDDDDVEELSVTCAATWGAVWFEHPAIDKLSFYRSKKCRQTPDDILTFPFALSDLESGKLPKKIYVRLDGSNFMEQTEGDLVMKFGKADKSQTWAENKLSFTVVKHLGDKKYFHAVRDYIFEKNTRFFAHEKRYDNDTSFRIVSMREEGSVMYPIDAARRPGGGVLNGIDAVAGAFPDINIAINGNMCFFSVDYYNSTAGKAEAVVRGLITDKCHGRIVRSKILDPLVSSDNDDTTTSPAGSLLAGQTYGRYVAQYDEQKRFVLAAGRVPLATAPDQVAGNPGGSMGGLSTNYGAADRIDREYQAVGYAPVVDLGKGIVFTATQSNGTGKGPDLAADAKKSGVQALPGGGINDIQLLLLDGGTSTALAYTKPDGVMETRVKEFKHTVGYFINTYLLFRCESPRSNAP